MQVMGNCCLVTDFLAAPTDHTECFAKQHYRKNSTFQTVKHRRFGSEHAHEDMWVGIAIRVPGLLLC